MASMKIAGLHAFGNIIRQGIGVYDENNRFQLMSLKSLKTVIFTPFIDKLLTVCCISMILEEYPIPITLLLGQYLSVCHCPTQNFLLCNYFVRFDRANAMMLMILESLLMSFDIMTAPEHSDLGRTKWNKIESKSIKTECVSL